jgi:hypothetical protein
VNAVEKLCSYHSEPGSVKLSQRSSEGGNYTANRTILQKSACNHCQNKL